MEHQITIMIDHEGISVNTKLKKNRVIVSGDKRLEDIRDTLEKTLAVVSLEYPRPQHPRDWSYRSSNTREKHEVTACDCFPHVLWWIENGLGDGNHQIDRLGTRKTSFSFTDVDR